MPTECADYPDNHHPSLGPTIGNPDRARHRPRGGQRRPDRHQHQVWSKVTTDHFEQAAYGLNAAVYGSAG